MPSPQPTAKTRDHVDYVSRRGELPYGMHNRDEIVNYFAWVVGLFEGYLRGKIIDHGAGTGSLTSVLVAGKLGSVVALEPDPQLVEVLHDKLDAAPQAEVFAGTLDDYLARHGTACVDSIVSSNVIEHIEDDVACLGAMCDLLRPGGAVCIYVPARPELFGSLDAAVGHFRRYTREELEAKLTRSGFRVVSVKYRNLVAVLPWLVVGRVLKRDKIGSGSIKIFDRVIFPVFRRLEALFPLGYGLNLVAIGVKP